MQGHTQICQVLMHNMTNPEQVNVRGSNPMHMAALCGHADCVEVLGGVLDMFISDGNLYGITPLHAAAFAGADEAIATLCDLGADTELGTIRGSSAAHCAICHAKLDATGSARTKGDDVLEALYHHGASIALQNTMGEAPLHLAVQASSTTSVSTLLHLGAPLELTTPSAQSALTLAVRKWKDAHEQRAERERKIQQGTAEEKRYLEGATTGMLHTGSLVEATEQVISTIIRHCDVDGNSILNSLMEDLCLDTIEDTARAAELSYTLRELVFAGADIERPVYGQTPLQIAIEHSRTDAIEALVSVEGGVDANTDEILKEIVHEACIPETDAERRIFLESAVEIVARTGPRIDDGLIKEAMDPIKDMGNIRVAKALLQGRPPVILAATATAKSVGCTVPLELAEELREGSWLAWCTKIPPSCTAIRIAYAAAQEGGTIRLCAQEPDGHIILSIPIIATGGQNKVRNMHISADALDLPEQDYTTLCVAFLAGDDDDDDKEAVGASEQITVSKQGEICKFKGIEFLSSPAGFNDSVQWVCTALAELAAMTNQYDGEESIDEGQTGNLVVVTEHGVA